MYQRKLVQDHEGNEAVASGDGRSVDDHPHSFPRRRFFGARLDGRPVERGSVQRTNRRTGVSTTQVS